MKATGNSPNGNNSDVKQEHSENPFNLKCIICSRQLKTATSLKDSNVGMGFNIPILSTVFGKRSAIHAEGTLVCTNGDDYSLSEVSEFQADSFLFKEDVLKHWSSNINKEVSMYAVLQSPNNRMYNVNYGRMTKLKANWRKPKKPSPSYNVLDDVKIYLCIRDEELLEKSIIFSCVGEKSRLSLNEWKYYVVSYEIV